MTVSIWVCATHQVVLGPSALVQTVNQALHSVLRARVHTNLAVVIDGHEAPLGVNSWVDHFEVDAILFSDCWPVVDGSATQRVDTQAHSGVTNSVEVDDVFQVIHIVLAEVETLNEL